MPPAAVVVLNMDDPFLVNRYADDGSFAGDTWHRAEEEATEQLEFEYEAGFEGWLDVPATWRDDELGFVSMILGLNAANPQSQQ